MNRANAEPPRATHRRIGLFGGTFDPPHTGHIALALHVQEKIDLGQVWFIPSATPPHKTMRTVSPAAIRWEMTCAAIEPFRPGFLASEIELERDGLSFTYQTVEEIRRLLGREAELFWIIGRDNIVEMPSWMEPHRILKEATVVAGGRHGVPMPDSIPDWLAEKLIVLDGPDLDVSSTDIRSKVGQGVIDPERVPEGVAQIIKREGLYGYPGTTPLIS